MKTIANGLFSFLIIGIIANAANYDAIKTEAKAPFDNYNIFFSSEDAPDNTRADVIVTKFRIYGNMAQYRRWNQTRGYWVDPEWIDIGVVH